MTWLLAFALTCAVEFPIVAALAPTPRIRVAIDSLAANLCTHPMAYWLVTHGWLGFWPTEAAVCVVEAAIYLGASRLPWQRAAAISLAANGVTMAMSFLW